MYYVGEEYYLAIVKTPKKDSSVREPLKGDYSSS